MLAYLPTGSPGHILFGLAVLGGRLLLLFAVAWMLALVVFHTFSKSDRAGNVAFAIIVTLVLAEAIYMLLHHA